MVLAKETGTIESRNRYRRSGKSDLAEAYSGCRVYRVIELLD
jgi:hypothetical protein